jgi:hypothetical protein
MELLHEYGHGISIRLSGGANNSSCLDNADQMGWSDWIALMQIKPGDFGGDKRGIGTLFLHKLQMVRIRDFQYSTDRRLIYDLCFYK